MEAPVYPIQSPQLVYQAVGDVLPVLRAELPWLTHLYGVVESMQDEKDRKVRYPVIYRQDSTKFFQAVLPNEKTMSALGFFEKNGPSSMSWDSGAEYVMGTWQHPVNLVCWLNLPKIDTRGYDFSSELAADLLRVLRLQDIGFESIDFRMDRVFDRYALAEKKLLLYPFAGFKLPLTLTSRYNACTTPFQKWDSAVEYLAAEPDQFLSV